MGAPGKVDVFIILKPVGSVDAQMIPKHERIELVPIICR